MLGYAMVFPLLPMYAVRLDADAIRHRTDGGVVLSGASRRVAFVGPFVRPTRSPARAARESRSAPPRRLRSSLSRIRSRCCSCPASCKARAAVRRASCRLTSEIPCRTEERATGARLAIGGDEHRCHDRAGRRVGGLALRLRGFRGFSPRVLCLVNLVCARGFFCRSRNGETGDGRRA